MRLDLTRLPRGLALLAWAAFFDWLWLTDGAGRYVGPRTSWIVPFGAIVLTTCAVVYLFAGRRSVHGRAPSVRDSLAALALLAPLVLVAAAPTASLGSLAVERKRSTGDQVAAVERAGAAGPAITLYDLSIAATSAEFARDRGIAEGAEVTFDGFVSREAKGGTMELSRFLASCCAADAMPYSVDVRPPAGADAFGLDTWVRVRGRVTGVGGAFEVVADRIDATRPPSNPYSYGT
jgi:uncharacterized repeat protein (TIGR03943 family)